MFRDCGIDTMHSSARANDVSYKRTQPNHNLALYWELEHDKVGFDFGYFTLGFIRYHESAYDYCLMLGTE